MQVSSYPDLLAYSRRNRTTAQIRDQIQTVSQEAVTGLKSDLKSATNGDVGRAHLLQKAQSDLLQAQEVNTLSETRLSFMSGAVAGARTTLNSIDTRGFIALNSGTPTGTDAIADEAENTIALIMNALSTSHGERNLFSGDRTNVTPFAGAEALLEDVRNLIATAPNANAAMVAIDDYFDTPGGGFDTNIYQGGDGNPPALPVGNGQTLQVGIKANNQEIKDTLKGLTLMATAKESLPPTDATGFAFLFEEGTKAAAKGGSGLIRLETELGTLGETVEKAKTQNDSERASLSLAFQNLFGRDQFEAAAELQSLQIQLEASYTITSRLSNLTLTNFLR